MEDRFRGSRFLAIALQVLAILCLAGVLFCLAGSAMSNWQAQPLEIAISLTGSALLLFTAAAILKIALAAEANSREILYEMRMSKETGRPSRSDLSLRA